MTLSNSEQIVYNALSIDWSINPVIAGRCGFMHNHTAKILSFLIKKNVVESRYYTGSDGKTRRYKEYRKIK